MVPDRATSRRVAPGSLTRRGLLTLAAASALAGCTPIGSTGTPAASTPTPILRVPLGTMEPGNASRIAALGALRPADYYLRGVAWSPDGRRVAAGGGMNLYLWDVSTGQAAGTWHGHSDQIYGMAWSPTTNLLASASGDGTVRLWNGTDGNMVRVLRGPAIAPVSVAWAPAGDRLAIGTFDGLVLIVEMQTGRTITTLNGPPTEGGRGRNPYAVFGVSWTPDGQRLASTRYDRYVLVWEASTGKPLATQQVDSQPNAVAWSPDGGTFTSSHDDGTVHIWDGTTYTAGVTLSAHTEAGWAFPMGWSPDGQLLAVARETGLVQGWDPRSAQQVTALTGHTAGVWALSWSPDGTRLASASDDETLRLWGVR